MATVTNSVYQLLKAGTLCTRVQHSPWCTCYWTTRLQEAPLEEICCCSQKISGFNLQGSTTQQPACQQLLGARCQLGTSTALGLMKHRASSELSFYWHFLSQGCCCLCCTQNTYQAKYRGTESFALTRLRFLCFPSNLLQPKILSLNLTLSLQ